MTSAAQTIPMRRERRIGQNDIRAALSAEAADFRRAPVFLLFAVSVVSIPMLLDREIDVVTAMVASFRAVLESRAPMLLWGAVIASASVAAMAPRFLGMLVVFPVLGHASWHLYRRAFAPD